MAELKTQATTASVADFVAGLDEDRRRDCKALVSLMKRATGAAPKMWGAGIVGFGSVRLKYESGRELDWFPVGFASRKSDLTLYGLGLDDAPALLDALGAHKRGKGCLYIKRLADVDVKVLEKLVGRAFRAKQK